jgi:hypothetical protein
MTSSFAKHSRLRWFPEFPNLIQLFIQPRRPLLHSDFGPLLQPMIPFSFLVHRRTLGRNAAAPIQCFDSEHGPAGIHHKRFVSANQLLQAARRLSRVPDRTDHARPQQLCQLPCVSFVAFRSFHQ